MRGGRKEEKKGGGIGRKEENRDVEMGEKRRKK